MWEPTNYNHEIEIYRFEYKDCTNATQCGWKIEVFCENEHVTTEYYRRNMNEEMFILECEIIKGWFATSISR